MPTRRLDRSIRLLQLLQQQPGLSLAEIAKWLSCSVRTVHRDLLLLRDNGFDVQRVGDGYRLSKRLDLPAADLLSDELLLILIALQASNFRHTQVGQQLTQRALQKLLASCSPATQARWTMLSNFVEISPDAKPIHPDEVSRLSTLATALERGRPVVVAPSPQSPLPRARYYLAPGRIIGQASGWYVEGFVSEVNQTVRIPLADVVEDSSAQAPNSPATSSPAPVPSPHLDHVVLPPTHAESARDPAVKRDRPDAAGNSLPSKQSSDN